MNRPRRSAEWSLVIFVVALLALNPPILSIFSVPKLLFGIPILYLYIFAAWGAAIVLLAINVSGLNEPEVGQPLRIPGPPRSGGPDGDALPPPLAGPARDAAQRDAARRDKAGV
jgi:hypothetical protein